MAPTASPKPLRIGRTLFEWSTRTFVMGVINATPDSFSGDGLLDATLAAERACAMVEAGADLIDIGAESTRPGGDAVDASEEWTRLEPVLRAVRDAVDVPLSVDTVKATVADRALDAGADALNDINGLRGDEEMASVIAHHRCPAILMHNQRGRDGSGDPIADVRGGLEESLRIAERAGIDRELLILDPGFGFGWEVEENLQLLARAGELRSLGRPLLIGTSRKSTIGALLDRPEGDLPASDRLWGTAATVALAVEAAIDIVRVHDVQQMVAVARLADAAVRVPVETL